MRKPENLIGFVRGETGAAVHRGPEVANVGTGVRRARP